jgi:hypothetical protein
MQMYFAMGFWTHSTWTTDRKDCRGLFELARLCALGLRRHIKVRGKANPYAPATHRLLPHAAGMGDERTSRA